MNRLHYFAYRSFRPEFAAMRNFAGIGVDTICIFPANTSNSLGEPYSAYPKNRNWFGSWDFSPVKRQLDDVLAVNPAARFIVIADLNSPEWLSRQLALSHESGDSTTHLTEALANRRWLEETTRYLEAFLDFAETNSANRVDAYVLACGNTDEWFDHNGELCGAAKERLYNEFRARRGLPPEAPPSALKLNTPDFDGLLFDPAKSRNVFEYRRFCNELVADGILHFARTARKHIRPEAEIGVFFGYLAARLGAAESGHVEMERILAAPEIDFLVSPGSYSDRAMGGGSGFQTLSGSERIAGKRHLHECDQRTSTYNPHLTDAVKLEFPHWEDLAEDIAGLRRETALALTAGSSLWWFDMWGGFYGDHAQLAELKRLAEIYEARIGVERGRVDEIAFIVDPEANYYLDQRSSRQAEFLRAPAAALNRVGAPYDTYALNDIPKIPEFGRYRFVVFANLFEITPEKEALLQEHVWRDGRTCLYLYAPGISDGSRIDPAFVERFAGVPFGTPGLSVIQQADHSSACLAKPAEITPALLRSLATESGVRILASEEVPVYADERLLAVHLAEPGRLRITLPRFATKVTELFSGKEFRDTEEIDWDSPGIETLLFESEP